MQTTAASGEPPSDTSSSRASFKVLGRPCTAAAATVTAAVAAADRQLLKELQQPVQHLLQPPQEPHRPGAVTLLAATNRWLSAPISIPC